MTKAQTHDSRDFHWYVACVPPQRELAVEQTLAGEGYATFVPVAREHQFANEAAAGRDLKHRVAVPIMPRYIFLGLMPGLTPGWDRVYCYCGPLNHHKRRLITGVLGVDGEPVRVRHDQLRSLMLRHSSGEFNAPESHRYMRLHHEFGPGDMVTTEGELFRGLVIEIEDREALVEVEIFGGKRRTRISLAKLVALA